MDVADRSRCVEVETYDLWTLGRGAPAGRKSAAESMLDRELWIFRGDLDSGDLIKIKPRLISCHWRGAGWVDADQALSHLTILSCFLVSIRALVRHQDLGGITVGANGGDFSIRLEGGSQVGMTRVRGRPFRSTPAS